MKARQLFFKRFVEEWRFQWGVINAVVDWIILIYIIVPGLIAVSIVYRDMWLHTDYYWSSLLPLSFLFVLVILITVRGNVRTFLKEADLLQLLQRPHLVTGLRGWSFLFTWTKLLLGQWLLFLIIFPVLRFHFHLTYVEMICFFLMISAFRLSAWTIKKLEDRTFLKWVFLVMLMLATLLILNQTPLLLAGFLGLGIDVGLCLLYAHKLLRTNVWFEKEIQIEDQERVKYVKLIISMSMEVAKSTPIKKHQPFVLFPKSMRLFRKRTKVNGLTEILIKAFLRNRIYLASYLRYLVVLNSGLALIPLTLKIPVFFVVLVGVNFWLKAIYNSDLLSSAFFSVVPVEDKVKERASLKSRRFLLLPFVIFMLVISSVHWFH